MTRVHVRRCIAVACLGSLVASGAHAALTISMEMNPDPVRAGERLNTQVTVTNNGASAVNNVTVEATVAAGISDGSVYSGFSEELLSGGGTCNASPYTNRCDPDETIIWTLGTVAGGRSVTLTVPLPVSPTATTGTVIDVPARVLIANVEAAATSALATVDTDHPLTVEVDESQDPIAPGAALTYTISFGNRSFSPVDNVTLTVPIPANTTLLSASDNGTQIGDSVQWDLDSVADGQVGRRQMVVAVNGGLGSGTVLSTTAVIDGTGAGGPETARGKAVTAIRTGISPQVHVNLNPDPVRPGERLRGRITVFNPSATPLTGVILTGWVPLEVDDLSNYQGFDEALLSGDGNCNDLQYTNYCDRDDRMVWSIGVIPAGSSAVVTVPLPVADTAQSGRLVTLRAAAVTGGGVQTTNDDTVGVNAAGALTIELDGSQDVVQPGENLTYTVSVGNRSLDEVSATTLTLPLPVGTSVISTTDGATVVGNRIEWTLGSLLAGQTERRQATVQVNPAATGGTPLISNAAEVKGTGIVTEIARSRASGHVETVRPVNVVVGMNPSPVRPGERLRTQLTVSNPGTSPLNSVILTARVPQEVDDASAYAGFDEALLSNGGNCDRGLPYTNYCDFGELMTWNLGTLQPGRGATVSAPLPVATGTEAGRQIALEMLVTAAGDIYSSLETTAGTDPDSPLLLEIDDSADPVLADANYTYTLTYSNRGAAPTTNAVMTFPIPDGTTRISSPGGTVSGNSVIWTLGTIPAGTGGRRLVTVHAPITLPGGTVIAADAWLRGTNGAFPAIAASHSATRVALSRALLVGTKLTPNPVGASQNLSSTITLHNDSGVALVDVVVDARVPLEIDDATAYVGFPETLLSPGGNCDRGLPYTNYCDFGELMTWNIGALAADATTTVSVPMPVAAGTSAGRQVVLEVTAKDAGSEYAATDATALVGVMADADGDSVGDNIDNCLGVANADQCDTDGDGYGNRCDGDLNNNGFTNAQDTTLLRAELGKPSVTPVYNKADLNCNGFVNAQDTVLFRSLLGAAPGPSAVAP